MVLREGREWVCDGSRAWRGRAGLRGTERVTRATAAVPGVRVGNGSSETHVIFVLTSHHTLYTRRWRIDSESRVDSRFFKTARAPPSPDFHGTSRADAPESEDLRSFATSVVQKRNVLHHANVRRSRWITAVTSRVRVSRAFEAPSRGESPRANRGDDLFVRHSVERIVRVRVR